MVTGVIFDIDGTLVTFHFDVRGAKTALTEELARMGFDTSGIGLDTTFQKMLDAAREQSDAGRGTSYAELRAYFFAVLEGYEARSAEITSIIPGVRQALDSLRSRGVRLGVLSNSGKKAAYTALGRAGLLGYFEFILTRDDTEIMKPRPEGVVMAAANFGLPARSVYYVGDSPMDIHAAKAAGITMVAVATGNATAERLKAEGADFTIASLAELGAIVGV
ncbi:MAG: HAD family hydrolase [Nitrososphaerota archaeon]|nr:HAD family hydrolase [Nitrososphaerota archaeon]